MHELSIATRIVDIVTRVMEENSAREVGAVTVEIGPLSGVDRSSLEFCFTALAKGTKLEKAHLKIEEISPRAKCRKCASEYEVSLDDFRCKACGSSNFEVLSGTDITVREVEVE
ncbi:MAG: hydrogenase maturation nickel metallochaperone HypA [Candidatus Eisenbacteria bacterium]